MIVSPKKYNQINELFIILIACTIVFRTLCTPIIIVFILFNLWHYKMIKIEKRQWLNILIISSPFLISILFFFNNETISGGLKSIEKVFTLALFPLLILTNKKLRLSYIFNQYSIWFTLILCISLIRFVFLFPEKIEKYSKGIDLIEIGYQFAISLGTHAPALNLHICFLTVVNFYFLIQGLIQQSKKGIFKSLILFILSFSFLLIVNTRIALLNVIICFVVILIKEFSKKYSIKKVIMVTIIGLFFSIGLIGIYAKINPYMKEKYSTVTFAYMDKIGKLDEIKNPEIVIFNALVTRITIWKSAYEVAYDNLPFGVGAADGKDELFEYYKKTNQKFLAKYEFPVHNQFLDYAIKFGIFGLFVCAIYLFYPFYTFIKLPKFQSLFICFGIIFFISNLTDDFLIRFDGIVFSGLFYSLFSSIMFYNKPK